MALTTGLFHRAIMESGDVLSPGALNRPGVGKNQSTTVGQRLGCPTDKSSTLIRCLKTKKANDIVGISCPEQVHYKISRMYRFTYGILRS